MTHSNIGRVLTLTVRIVDDEASKWIWKAYGDPQYGVEVIGIANDSLQRIVSEATINAMIQLQEEDAR